MSYDFYKILHVTALFITVMSLIGYAFNQTKEKPSEYKKLFSILHGVGLLIVIISGFGLSARLGYMSDFPKWIYLKIILWLTLGGLIAFVKRQKLSPKIIFLVISIIVLLGSVTAVTKFI